MKKRLIIASKWMQIHEIQDAATPKKTIEIDITGIIGGSYWDDDNPESKNTKEKMRAELKAIAELDAELIIVNIDSPGGSVAHGLSIHDLLASHPAEKETRIIGMTASIATVIAQAGQTRKMSDNALFLVHHASMGMMGGFNATELGNVISDLNAVDARLEAIYVKRTGKDSKEIKDLMDANGGMGKWMDSEETKEYGLVDETFEPTRAAATVDPVILAKFKYPNLPIDMTKVATDTRSLLDRIKDGIIAIFAKSPEDNKDVPKEIQDQLTEFDTQLTALEEENTRLESEASANGTQVTELTSQVETLTGTVAERDQTITDLNTRIGAQETEINKLKAGSTIPKGKVGGEGSDPAPLSAEEIALQKDLENLRKEQTAVRNDGVEDDPKTKIK